MDQEKSLDTLLEERMTLQNGTSASTNDPSAPMPPTMARAKESSVDDLLAEMNRIPLFMTSLDESDGSGGENLQLEALKAIAYEGTRAEIAQNFREQGTELIRAEGRYAEARDFYSKAITALRSPRPPEPEPEPEERVRVVEIDEEAEERKEREIEEVCLVNRALCNLEMNNHGQCKRDCAEALRINPKNVKAWYRAASACLATDKIEEALDACQSGLNFDGQNAALKTLLMRVEKRRDHLAALETSKREREDRTRAESATLRQGLKARNITTRTTSRPPEMPEASLALASPLDATSTLSFPVMILYPLHAQTDFIKAFAEDSSLNEHLEYILPLPWDEDGEYVMHGEGAVECYMETSEGGLIKAGKKLSLLKFLGSGRLEIVDGLVKVFVVPKSRAAEWIAEFKKKRGKV